jgi:transcriptional regulator with XRE-family HTH domain
MATLKTIVAGQLKKLDITQKELAERAGLNPPYINEILSGKKLRVQQRFVPALAHALEIEPGVLFEKSAGVKKKKTASSTPAAARRTIIRANSPETLALFSNEMRAFQLDPDFDPNRHVPLFIERFPSDYRVRLKDGDVAKFRPFVWPEFLGPSIGCYAMRAGAVGENSLPALWVYLVAPCRSIKLGDVFVGEFRYGLGSASLEVHKMQDATELSFILTDINSEHARSFPRGAIRRFHKVVGLLEQPE